MCIVTILRAGTPGERPKFVVFSPPKHGAGSGTPWLTPEDKELCKITQTPLSAASPVWQPPATGDVLEAG